MRHATRSIPNARAAGVLLVALASAYAPRAWAHDLGAAQLDLGVAGSRVEAHAIYAASARVDPRHWVDKQLSVEVNGEACEGRLDRSATNDQDFEIWATFVCPDPPGTIAATVFELAAREQIVTRIHAGDLSTQAVLTAEKRQLSLVVSPPAPRPAKWPWLAGLALLVTLIIVTFFVRRPR